MPRQSRYSDARRRGFENGCLSPKSSSPGLRGQERGRDARIQEEAEEGRYGNKRSEQLEGAGRLHVRLRVLGGRGCGILRTLGKANG